MTTRNLRMLLISWWICALLLGKTSHFSLPFCHFAPPNHPVLYTQWTLQSRGWSCCLSFMASSSIIPVLSLFPCTLRRILVGSVGVLHSAQQQHSNMRINPREEGRTNSCFRGAIKALPCPSSLSLKSFNQNQVSVILPLPLSWGKKHKKNQNRSFPEENPRAYKFSPLKAAE